MVAGLMCQTADVFAESAGAKNSGMVDARYHYALNFGVSGRVAEIHAAEGARVRAGEILAGLHPAVFRARLNAGVAAHEFAEAQYAETGRQAQRSAVLYQEGSLSTVEYDRAERMLLKARMELAEAKAELEQARMKLALSEIIAPVDGVVERINIGVGQNLHAQIAAEPAIIFRSAELVISVLVPESAAPNIPRIGDQVSYRTAAGQSSGQVVTVRKSHTADLFEVLVTPSDAGLAFAETVVDVKFPGR